MPSLDLPNCLIWFAHCPKAGGTSVEKLMVATWGDRVGNLHWGWDLWWRKGGWRLAEPPNSPQHLVWKDAQAVLRRKPDVVFALTRDPLARMISEFNWQRAGLCGTRAGKILAHLPFAFWLRLMLRVVVHNPHAFDNHLRLQGDFIPDHAKVFRLEEGLEPVAAWLSEVTGHGLDLDTLPHALKTRSHLVVGAREAALIGRAFSADYERFGYCKPTGPATRIILDGLAYFLAPLISRLNRIGQL